MNNQTEFDIFIIKTLPDEYLIKCKKSLKETSNGKITNNQIHIISEKESREITLNTILEKRDNVKDLFIVADDIVFLDGWFESLKDNYENGGIIGFSMIDAQSELLQDFGYDFVTIDGELSYRGLYKHKELTGLNLPSFRICDAVTGCAIYIKKAVLNDVNHFPLEGENRWGELLFSYLASKYGHDTIVLSAHLRHFGTSTKQNKDVKKSSMSWLIEKELWIKAVKKYLNDVKPENEIKITISDELKALIRESAKCLIYGAGTIANAIISSLQEISNIELCSGLKEEIGLRLGGIKIKNVERINSSIYNVIIISAIGYENQIIDNYFKNKNVLTLSKENNVIKILYKN